MKKLKYILLLSLCFFHGWLHSQLVKPNDPNWTLIFEDNFSTVDRTKWTIKDDCESWERVDTFMTYRDHTNNVSASGGLLHLKLTQTTHKNRPFSSGYILSKNEFGKGCFYELRTKYDESKGPMWPTFWAWSGWRTYPGEVSPCDYQEIDFFDNTLWPKSEFNASCNQVGGIWCKTNHTTKTVSYFKVKPFKDIYYGLNSFNTHQCLWLGSKITHFVNDIEYLNYPNFSYSLNKPMQITIRLQNGVTNHRDYITSSAHYQTEYNKLLANVGYDFQLDYLRIWKLKKDCNTVVNDIPNWNTYVWGLKKKINLSGATTFASNASRYLYSIDGFDLNTGFEVSNSCSLELWTIPDCDF